MNKALRAAVRWGAPPILGVASFAIGYVASYRGLASRRLSDGSERWYAETAARIDDGKLLEKASPLERVAWMLEICQQPRTSKRDHALFAAIQQLQPGDFMAAITDVSELSKRMTAMDADLRADVIQACVERWLDVDEEGLRRWLPIARGILESEDLRTPKMGERDLGVIYLAMARRNPGWMFEQIQQLGPTLQRGAAVAALLESAVEAGLPQAEQWLASFRGTPEYAAARSSYIKAFARADPERALTILLGDPTDKSDLASKIICDCAAQRPDLATALLDKLDEKQRLQVARSLVPILAANPSADAFKWLDEQLAQTPTLLENQGHLLGYLVARDGPKTLESIRKVPETERESMTELVLYYWINSDSKTYLEWMDTHPDLAAFQNSKFFGRLPVMEPEAFAKWIGKLPSGDMQQGAQISLARQMMSRGQMTEAIRLFPADAKSPDSLGRANQFGGDLVRANPQEATRWLEGLPPGALRANAATGVINQWLQLAPANAAQWVEQLPAGDLRDMGAGAMATNPWSEDFDGGNAWLSQIQSQPERDRVAARMFDMWATRRPAQTREWLRGLPNLSESVRNRLLRKLP